ncbi:hypothetical protein [Sphingobium bisphenolivorans]|uniref:hypothetical protein n=1 Tax=Sphingobium bisphenolivorans TaxID=1335760 RepID=UPI0003B39E5F|nr:hypothetical protein [Sphingobium bisphenolivorans]
MRDHMADIHGLFYQGFFKDVGVAAYSAVVLVSSWAQLIAPIASLVATSLSIALVVYRWRAIKEDRKAGKLSE